MWKHQVGIRVEQLRTERNLSRSKFGEMIGVSGQYVGKIERGKHSLTGATIAKICTATGVSSDYIIFGSVNPNWVAGTLNGFSNEQVQIVFDIVMNVVQFLNTSNANNLLIKEVFSQQNSKNIY